MDPIEWLRENMELVDGTIRYVVPAMRNAQDVIALEAVKAYLMISDPLGDLTNRGCYELAFMCAGQAALMHATRNELLAKHGSMEEVTLTSDIDLSDHELTRFALWMIPFPKHRVVLLHYLLDVSDRALKRLLLWRTPNACAKAKKAAKKAFKQSSAHINNTILRSVMPQLLYRSLVEFGAPCAEASSPCVLAPSIRWCRFVPSLSGA